MTSKFMVVAALAAVPFLLPRSEVVAVTSTAPRVQDPTLEIYDFVTSIHIHGVDYGAAHDLGPAALPLLEEYLNSPRMKAHWPNIISTMAFIGEPQVHDILDGFIMNRFEGEVDLMTFQALICAQGALGHVGDPQLSTELAQGADPAYWLTLPWQYKHYNGEHLQILWSKLSINALSYTASEHAEESLRGLEQAPFHPRQMSNITEGLERIPTIRSMGIEAFERDRDRQRAERF